ncbi:MAG: hypothetical protein IKM60_02435 [Clostridia bacterium]|nr:hypothetical protein [Clostridia bacterium]
MLDMNFDVSQVLAERLASSLGLDKYRFIMEQVKQTDISKNAAFQRTYNGFYIVRRNEAWRKQYYGYFEKIKYEQPVFENILTYLYEKTGNIEPSFSSKMLATISPEKPIWDRYVVTNLGLELTGSTKEQKLCNAIALYSDIEAWYDAFLQTDKAKECIQTFDRLLPTYAWLTDIKKVDTILWSIR